MFSKFLNNEYFLNKQLLSQIIPKIPSCRRFKWLFSYFLIKTSRLLRNIRIATPPKFNYYSSNTHIIQSLKTRADAFSFVVTKFNANVNINKIET